MKKAHTKTKRSDTFSPDHRLGVITSAWHSDLVDVCKDALYKELEKLDIDTENSVTHFEAPGSLEFPIIAQAMAKTGEYAAIAVISLIVDGGIYRHEFVASAVIDAIVRISTETKVPILSAALTPQHFHEHQAHLEFFRTHLVEKGTELAHACAKTVHILHKITK
jgi:6,7-dimethyl-8-ribityllumazine synthase